MNRALVYLVGFIGAAFAAVVLLVLEQNVFDVSSETIVDNSLASADLLCIACAFGALNDDEQEERRRQTGRVCSGVATVMTRILSGL